MQTREMRWKGNNGNIKCKIPKEQNLQHKRTKQNQTKIQTTNNTLKPGLTQVLLKVAQLLVTHSIHYDVLYAIYFCEEIYSNHQDKLKTAVAIR